MSQKVARNALGKVNVILGIASSVISSALVLILTYAPTKTELIATLQYIVNVLQSIMQVKPIPQPPAFLTVQSRALDSTEEMELEPNESYREITIAVSESIQPEFKVETGESEEVPRTN